MKSETQLVLDLVSKEKYSDAQNQCEIVVQNYMTAFMEELTVNSATDYVGSVILYSRICGALKKPWKSFRKLEASRGALRFLKDYMSDGETLAEVYQSYGDAYAAGNYLPEASVCFFEAAKLFENEEKSVYALDSALYYEARFGKQLLSGLDFFEERIGVDRLCSMKDAVVKEASGQVSTDPIENTDAFLDVRYEVEEITDEIISKETSFDAPYCVLYWNTKKAVLKDRFDIEWNSPAEMNPNIRFY